MYFCPAAQSAPRDTGLVSKPRGSRLPCGRVQCIGGTVCGLLCPPQGAGCPWEPVSELSSCAMPNWARRASSSIICTSIGDEEAGAALPPDRTLLHPPAPVATKDGSAKRHLLPRGPILSHLPGKGSAAGNPTILEIATPSPPHAGTAALYRSCASHPPQNVIR